MQSAPHLRPRHGAWFESLGRAVQRSEAGALFSAAQKRSTTYQRENGEELLDMNLKLASLIREVAPIHAIVSAPSEASASSKASAPNIKASARRVEAGIYCGMTQEATKPIAQERSIKHHKKTRN